MKFYLEALNKAQRKIISQLGPAINKDCFYLGGGTAIALHLGHRKSVDLDWFTQSEFRNPLNFSQELRNKNIKVEVNDISRGTLHGVIKGVRVSFFEFKYPLLKPLIKVEEINCNIASLEDLACMKLSAVAQRGSKKDFIDIYTIGMIHTPLKKMLLYYKKKFAVKDIGHLLYALVFFEDAERERMPEMFIKVDWAKIKKTITEWVKGID